VHALTLNSAVPVERPLQLNVSRKLVLLGICLCAGIAPLAVRWIGDDVLRGVCGALLPALYFAFAMFARRQASGIHAYWELAFAFATLALVQVLNNTLPA